MLDTEIGEWLHPRKSQKWYPTNKSKPKSEVFTLDKSAPRRRHLYKFIAKMVGKYI